MFSSFTASGPSNDFLISDLSWFNFLAFLFAYAANFPFCLKASARVTLSSAYWYFLFAFWKAWVDFSRLISFKYSSLIFISLMASSFAFFPLGSFLISFILSFIVTFGLLPFCFIKLGLEPLAWLILSWLNLGNSAISPTITVGSPGSRSFGKNDKTLESG